MLDEFNQKKEEKEDEGDKKANETFSESEEEATPAEVVEQKDVKVNAGRRKSSVMALKLSRKMSRKPDATKDTKD